MILTADIEIRTSEYQQYVLITDKIEQVVATSGIREGMVTVLSRHTTTGIMVNEALECLESDIEDFLGRIVPEDAPYAHARILPEYGTTAGNPTGHLRALVTGNHCHLIVREGALDRGGAQEVYLMEFDGPSLRTIQIQVIGER